MKKYEENKLLKRLIVIKCKSSEMENSSRAVKSVDSKVSHNFLLSLVVFIFLSKHGIVLLSSS